MRVEVDRDRCEGNAVCVGIAPDLFDLDDEDYAVSRPTRCRLTRRSWRAIDCRMPASCPDPQRLEVFIN